MRREPDQLERRLRAAAYRSVGRGLLIALLFGVLWGAGHLYTSGLRISSRLDPTLELRGNLYAGDRAPTVEEYRELARLLLNIPPLRRLVESGENQITLIADEQALVDPASPPALCGPLLPRRRSGSWSCEITFSPVGAGPIVSEVELCLAVYGAALNAYAQAVLPEGVAFTRRTGELILELQLELAEEFLRRGVPVDEEFLGLLAAGHH